MNNKITKLKFQNDLSILILAAWFGLLVGLLESFLVVIRKYYLKRTISLGVDFPWLIPVSEMFLFLGIGLILIIIAKITSKKIPLQVQVIIFVFFSLLTIYYVRPKFHIVAILLLAAGLSIQVVRLAKNYLRYLPLIASRTIGWLILVVLLIASFIMINRKIQEDRAVSQLPSIKSNAPNVLLIVLDTVRAKSLSVYGYDRPTTPNLNIFAETSVTFEHAVATAPWTLPSHASMFTGRWHHELNASWYTPLDDNYPTLAEVLASSGYNTAGFTANMYYCSYEHGLNRGFIHYEDYPISISQLPLYSSIVKHIINTPKWGELFGPHRLLFPKNARDINAEFTDWLSTQKTAPFFVYLNYFDAHQPYRPPEPYRSMYGQGQRANPRLKDKWEWSDSEIQAEIDAYDAAITYIDDQIGRLLNDLEKKGLADNTIIIITSDHGEQIGEHNLFDHTNSVYIQTLEVPLLIHYPSAVPNGVRISEPVSLRDIPTTVMDLIGLNRQNQFPGTPLSRFWNPDVDDLNPDDLILSELYPGDEGVQKWYPIAEGELKSIIEDQYHYILNGDKREELYSYFNDPEELVNLAISGNEETKLLGFRLKLSENLVDSQ